MELRLQEGQCPHSGAPTAAAFDVPGGIARGVYRPLSRPFATVPDMPLAYDVSAMLVRAVSESTKPERVKAKGVTLGAKVTPDLAEQSVRGVVHRPAFRAAAHVD